MIWIVKLISQAVTISKHLIHTHSTETEWIA